MSVILTISLFMHEKQTKYRSPNVCTDLKQKYCYIAPICQAVKT